MIPFADDNDVAVGRDIQQQVDQQLDAAGVRRAADDTQPDCHQRGGVGAPFDEQDRPFVGVPTVGIREARSAAENPLLAAVEITRIDPDDDSRPIALRETPEPLAGVPSHLEVGQRLLRNAEFGCQPGACLFGRMKQPQSERRPVSLRFPRRSLTRMAGLEWRDIPRVVADPVQILPALILTDRPVSSAPAPHHLPVARHRAVVRLAAEWTGRFVRDANPIVGMTDQVKFLL